MAEDPYSSARARPLDSDLTQGEWLGSSCAFCGTIYCRAQPHLLRESNQGRGALCLNCGRPSQCDWGSLVIRDGGVYFVPRACEVPRSAHNPPMPPDDEITRKVHIHDVDGAPGKSTK